MNAGRRLVAKILSNSATVVSVIGENSLIPALLTITSMSPHSSNKTRMVCSRTSSFFTSTSKKRALVCLLSRFPLTTSTSQKATFAPSMQNASTIALPIPDAAPVTNTRFSICLSFIFDDNPHNNRGAKQSGDGINRKSSLRTRKLRNNITQQHNGGTTQYHSRKNNAMIGCFHQSPGNVWQRNT